MSAPHTLDEVLPVWPAASSPAARASDGGPPAAPSAHDVPRHGRSAGGAPSDSAVDRELLRRVAGADREAFRQLYLRYQPRLSRFLFRILRRHEDISDISNDVLLIVWLQAGTFRGASQVSTWIFGIAYRSALNFLRRSAARERLASFEAEGSPLITEDSNRQTEDRQILNLGLAQLPPEQQIVLVLAYEMDCSCEEVAAIVNCPVSTVKTRMFHARRKMRSFICAAAAHRRAGAVDAGASSASTTPGCATIAARDNGNPARS